MGCPEAGGHNLSSAQKHLRYVISKIMPEALLLILKITTYCNVFFAIMGNFYSIELKLQISTYLLGLI